jgi:hypothetical protein
MPSNIFTKGSDNRVVSEQSYTAMKAMLDTAITDAAALQITLGGALAGANATMYDSIEAKMVSIRDALVP